MEIKKYVLGPLATNTFLLIEGKDALLIDPASKAEKLIEILGDYNLVGILLTHGHFDHIKAVDGLYDKYHCPIYIDQDDEQLARDKNAGSEFGLVAYISSPINYIKEGNNNIGPFNFEIVKTPGHTPGSAIYIFDDHIFTGDTLFKQSVGRTDLKGGNFQDLKKSLQFFKNLDRDYIIHPGHEDDTLLSQELKFNYFLQ